MRFDNFKIVFFIFCAIALSLRVQAQVYQSNWQSIDNRPVPEWFVDAKFGIFIHWGLYSVPSWGPTQGSVYSKYAEWYWARQNPDDKPLKEFTDFHNRTYGKNIYYRDFVKDFKAEMFDPGQWADIFRQSGAKYVVLTAKHHEGFAMWPSKESPNWNSVDVGPHRDLVGELTDAVKSKGLHMGLYYSLYEWYNPLYKENPSRYVVDHMIPQMKDLVVKYQPDIIWTDGEGDMTSEKWKSTEFLSWLYNDSPVRETVAVNDRWGKETRGKHGGFYTTEYDLIHNANASGKIIEHPWEECRGMGGSFGYNRNENLKDYETSESLVHILIDKVARGGNLLLNIGPTADGRIPIIMQQRLKDMGDWLAVNGDCIYGTKAWNKADAIDGKTTVFYTTKGDDLYVIITTWQNTPLVVKEVGKVSKVNLMGYKGKIKYTLSGNKIIITPPVITPANTPCQYAWVFKVKDGVKYE